MTRLTAQHLLADTIDTTAMFATEDARRMAELEAAIHPERAARVIAPPPPPPPLPLPQPKDEPMPPNEPVSNCSLCGKILRRNNTKGVCADRKKCTARSAAPYVPKDDGDDLLMGETATPAPKPAGRVGPIQRKHLERPAPSVERTPVAVGVEMRFRTVAEALGFDPSAELDTLMEGWLAEIRGYVDAAKGPRNV